MSKNEKTLREQLRKFSLKSIIGYHTILIYGMGTLLGIFDYLYNKVQELPNSGKVTSVSFSSNELYLCNIRSYFPMLATFW